jgi:hypothetical protein
MVRMAIIMIVRLVSVILNVTELLFLVGEDNFMIAVE